MREPAIQMIWVRQQLCNTLKDEWNTSHSFLGYQFKYYLQYQYLLAYKYEYCIGKISINYSLVSIGFSFLNHSTLSLGSPTGMRRHSKWAVSPSVRLSRFCNGCVNTGRWKVRDSSTTCREFDNWAWLRRKWWQCISKLFISLEHKCKCYK